MRWQAVARWPPVLSVGWRLAHCSERRLRAAPAIMHRRLSTSGPLPCMWNRPATGHEAPPFGTGIEAFGTGRASKFATEVFLHLQTGWPFTIVTAFAGGWRRRQLGCGGVQRSWPVRSVSRQRGALTIPETDHAFPSCGAAARWTADPARPAP